MQIKLFFISSSVIALGIVLFEYLKVDLIKLCELEKCPYCYGTDLCELVLKNVIKVREHTWITFFTNHFGVKNVIYATLFDDNIVLKKLAHLEELEKLDKIICPENNCNSTLISNNRNYTQELFEILTAEHKNNVANFKVCSKTAAAVFLKEVSSHFLEENNLKHIWTLLKVNVEPLLLKILNATNTKWPVPRYLGACGRVIAQSDCGETLNAFESADWFTRAHLAHQLLTAAKNFTFDHEKFIFYLTDVSPDNIAVDRDLNLYFVDLENVILALKTEGSKTYHSVNYEAESALFVYSEHEICSSSLSDHNFYAVCKLLLAPNAPWPMMEGGLLHHPPLNFAFHTKQLFIYLDFCVEPKGATTRFVAAEEILKILKTVLSSHDFK